MKKILFVALMACVVVGCSKSTSDQTPNSLQQSGLNGPVKSVDMRTYEATTYFGEVKKGDLIQNTQTISFTFPVCAGIRYDYNMDGNLIQYTLRDDREQIMHMQKKEYFQNHLIGGKYFNNRGELEFSWHYDVKNDKPVSKIATIYAYDSYESDQRSSMSDTLECTFDGFLAKSTCSKKNGKVISTSENTYEKGLIVYTVNYDSENNVSSHYEWKRNELGMITYYGMYDAEKELLGEDLTYDERGFLTHYIRRDVSPENTDYTVEYLSVDDYGNWTRRVVNKDQMPLYLQERTILYYEK